jgi:hypothetical protein
VNLSELPHYIDSLAVLSEAVLELTRSGANAMLSRKAAPYVSELILLLPVLSRETD